MITYAEELLKKNAPLIFVDYAYSQMNKLQSRLYELESGLTREKDEDKKNLITHEIELINKDIQFFRGEKQEENSWQIVGDKPMTNKDEDYDFEKDMDETMAKMNSEEPNL